MTGDTPDAPGAPDAPIGEDHADPNAPASPAQGRSMSVRTLAVAVGIIAVALIAVFVVTSGGGSDGDGSADALVGSTAPVVSGVDTNGDTVSTDEFLGKWVVLNFFATWCAPCVKEHPQLVAFNERSVERGDSVVVSVAYQEKPERVEQFFADHGGDWPVIVSGAESSTLEFGVRRLPESFLISPDGVVVHKFVGGVTADAIDAEIARAS